jgi:hypothetical protein
VSERPTLEELIQVFVKGDQWLDGSTCDCCEAKRELLKRLKEHGML